MTPSNQYVRAFRRNCPGVRFTQDEAVELGRLFSEATRDGRQANRVMSLIGPLLDAWDGMANDMKDGLRSDEPVLCKYLDKIAEEMER